MAAAALAHDTVATTANTSSPPRRVRHALPPPPGADGVGEEERGGNAAVLHRLLDQIGVSRQLVGALLLPPPAPGTTTGGGGGSAAAARLRRLTDCDMKALGCTIGERRRLRAWIASSAAAVPPPPPRAKCMAPTTTAKTTTTTTIATTTAGAAFRTNRKRAFDADGDDATAVSERASDADDDDATAVAHKAQEATTFSTSSSSSTLSPPCFCPLHHVAERISPPPTFIMCDDCGAWLTTTPSAHGGSRRTSAGDASRSCAPSSYQCLACCWDCCQTCAVSARHTTPLCRPDNSSFTTTTTAAARPAAQHPEQQVPPIQPAPAGKPYAKGVVNGVAVYLTPQEIFGAPATPRAVATVVRYSAARVDDDNNNNNSNSEDETKTMDDSDDTTADDSDFGTLQMYHYLLAWDYDGIRLFMEFVCEHCTAQWQRQHAQRRHEPNGENRTAPPAVAVALTTVQLDKVVSRAFALLQRLLRRYSQQHPLWHAPQHQQLSASTTAPQESSSTSTTTTVPPQLATPHSPSYQAVELHSVRLTAMVFCSLQALQEDIVARAMPPNDQQRHPPLTNEGEGGTVAHALASRGPQPQQEQRQPPVLVPPGIGCGCGGDDDDDKFLWRCPNHHAVSLHADPVTDAWCNQCCARVPAGTLLYSCRTCNWDVCRQCQTIAAERQGTPAHGATDAGPFRASLQNGDFSAAALPTESGKHLMSYFIEYLASGL